MRRGRQRPRFEPAIPAAEAVFSPIASGGLHSYSIIRESLAVRFRGNPERVYIYEGLRVEVIATFKAQADSGQEGSLRLLKRICGDIAEPRKIALEDFLVLLGHEAAHDAQSREQRAEEVAKVLARLRQAPTPIPNLAW